jgi:hypothetical protein
VPAACSLGHRELLLRVGSAIECRMAER